MPVVAWVTVVISALIIAAAALGLVRVLLHLKVIRHTLRNVVAGVTVVAQQTSTVPEVRPPSTRTSSPSATSAKGCERPCPLRR